MLMDAYPPSGAVVKRYVLVKVAIIAESGEHFEKATFIAQ